MTRSGPSAADRQLIGDLTARDLSVSAAQLERWRHAGLLPRNSRHGSGQGKGSVSAVSPEAVEIAAALARHTRPGRALRLAVVDWFADAGRPAIGRRVVPEPPHAAVREALAWVIGTDPGYRLWQQARSARTVEEQDDFYAAADAALPGRPRAAWFDPAVMREALLTRRDPPDGTFRRGRKVKSAMIQAFAWMAMGSAAVGEDLLRESEADLGLGSDVSSDWSRDWEGLLDNVEGPAAGPAGLADPLEMLGRANAELLQQARTAAWDLAGFGSLYLSHAFLMPDTPGLAALRGTVDRLGAGRLLMRTPLDIQTTDGFAFTVAACLYPELSALHKVLDDQARTGPHLLPQTAQGAKEYMATWLNAIHGARRHPALTSRLFFHAPSVAESYRPGPWRHRAGRVERLHEHVR